MERTISDRPFARVGLGSCLSDIPAPIFIQCVSLMTGFVNTLNIIDSGSPLVDTLPNCKQL